LIAVLREIGVLAQRDTTAISSFVIDPPEKSTSARSNIDIWLIRVDTHDGWVSFGKPDPVRWQVQSTDLMKPILGLDFSEKPIDLRQIC
jgi:hypothetical protein